MSNDDVDHRVLYAGSNILPKVTALTRLQRFLNVLHMPVYRLPFRAAYICYGRLEKRRGGHAMI